MEKIDAMINLAGELYEATRSIELLKESARFKRYSDIGPQGSCSTHNPDITVSAEKINQLMDLLTVTSGYVSKYLESEYNSKLRSIEDAVSALR